MDARKYHELLKNENTVVVDVRNHYETIIGRFDGQESVGGARYIDPKMRKSTDFKGWLAKEETKEKLKDKTVLMFCTGGIRCERASAYLKDKLGNEVRDVYQVSPSTLVMFLVLSSLLILVRLVARASRRDVGTLSNPSANLIASFACVY